MSLRIEKLNLGHSEIIIDGVNSVLELCFKDKSYTPETLRDHLRETDSKGYVIFDGENLVGFATFFRDIDDEDSTFVDYLWVSEKYRGKGMAETLLRYVFRYSKARRRNTVFLETSEDNKPAISLYNKIGFQKILSEDGYILFGIGL